MGDVILLRKLDETPGGYISFVGGPHDGTERLMGAGMRVIALPGTCPAYKIIYHRKPWDDDEDCPWQDGDEITQQSSTHITGCNCPEEWFGMQEYRVQQGVAYYVGRRPNPETEDDLEGEAPKLWTPDDGVPED